MNEEQNQMTDTTPESPEIAAKMRHWVLIAGLFTMALGVAAILLPFFATLTLEGILAVIFMVAGLIHIVHALHSRHSKGFIFRLLMGVLYELVGLILLVFPLQGALSLTLLLALLLMIAGAFKMAMALHLRPLPTSNWVMFSGAVSAVLGILIWMGLPGTSRWVIGLLIGIELVISGLTMTIFAFSIKKSGNVSDWNRDNATGVPKDM